MNRNLLLAIAWFGMCVYLGAVVYQVEVFVRVSNDYPQWMNTAILSFYIPHLIVLVGGIITNVVAWFLNNRILALVSAFIYVLAFAFYPFYFEQMMIQTALCFIAYGTMKPKTS
jgi:uncharacterized membrane protein